MEKTEKEFENIFVQVNVKKGYRLMATGDGASVPTVASAGEIIKLNQHDLMLDSGVVLRLAIGADADMYAEEDDGDL